VWDDNISRITGRSVCFVPLLSDNLNPTDGEDWVIGPTAKQLHWALVVSEGMPASQIEGIMHPGKGCGERHVLAFHLAFSHLHVCFVMNDVSSERIHHEYAASVVNDVEHNGCSVLGVVCPTEM